MTDQENPNLSYLTAVSVPVLSQQRFAELTGFAPGVVEGWINRGYIPSMLIGKHRVVNMVVLTQECIDQAQK
jgi:hypothetical protein